jgi:hypothetical protein
MLSPAYTLTPTPSKGMIVACLADITQHNNETLIKHAIRQKKIWVKPSGRYQLAILNGRYR